MSQKRSKAAKREARALQAAGKAPRGRAVERWLCGQFKHDGWAAREIRRQKENPPGRP